MPPSDQELLTLAANNQLAAAMANRFALTEGDGLIAIKASCVRLHNSGQWDLLALVAAGEVQGLSGSDFFMASHFLCELLPDLDADLLALIETVEALVMHGGNDMASNTPNVALRSWCAKDVRRARRFIEVARSGDVRAARNLTFALEALASPEEARSILELHDAQLAPAAVTALGRIADDDPASRRATTSVFAGMVDVADSFLKANILCSTAFLLSQEGAVVGDPELHLLGKLIEAPDEQIINASARILWAQPGARRQEIVWALLECASRGDPANGGWIREFDRSLEALLRHGYSERVIEFACDLFSGSEELKLGEFKAFLSALVAGPNDLLAQTAVVWLLNGSSKLCEPLSHAVGPDQDNAPVISAEDWLKGLSEKEQVFICKKSIGWFFLKARTAASILVSVLRICSDEVAAEVQELLVAPLLQNYVGLRDYLGSIPPSDLAYQRVKAVLDNNDTYLGGLRSVPELRELQPSEARRSIQHLRMKDQGRQIARSVRENSIFMRLVKNSTVLYGHRSIGFVTEPDGTLRPYEMNLQPHSVSFELPRMEITDPMSLEYVLRVFRAERLAK